MPWVSIPEPGGHGGRPSRSCLPDWLRYPGGAGSRTPCRAMGLHPRTRPSRRPALQVLSARLVTLSWRGGLPHALSRHGSPSQDQAVTEAGPPGSELLIWRADTRRWRNEGKPEALGLRRASPLSFGAERRRAEACRVCQSSGVLTGDAESLGGRGGVGIGGVLCAPESGDSRRSPKAAAKPPLKGPVEPRRRPRRGWDWRSSVRPRKRRFSPQSKGGGQPPLRGPVEPR